MGTLETFPTRTITCCAFAIAPPPHTTAYFQVAARTAMAFVCADFISLCGHFQCSTSRNFAKPRHLLLLSRPTTASLDHFRVADHPEIGQTSQYKRVSRYLSGKTSNDRTSG